MTDQLLPCPFCGALPESSNYGFLEIHHKQTCPLWAMVAHPAYHWNTRAQPATSEPKPVEAYTYASKQETNCAGCGLRKHTPLRVDDMGGYVCLTCIDKQLEAFFTHPAPAGVEALRKDAERYRWLRDKSESVHQFYMSTPVWFTGVKFSKENVDNTIDAARLNGVKP